MDRDDAAPIRVLVADDQKVVRDGLSLMLRMFEGIEVIGSAVDGDDAVRQALRDRPDVVLMDLWMPGCDGVAATARIVAEAPATRVVVLTTYTDDDWVFRALRAGARGFVTKDAGAEEIHRAIVTVARGQAELDPAVQHRLLEVLAQRPPAARGSGFAGESELSASSDASGLGLLTTRERDVLARIALGESNTEIAVALYVSPATVKTHVNRLLAKTGCRDRAQLVVLAYRTGMAG